jgi:SAM-dependent methyltransferase
MDFVKKNVDSTDRFGYEWNTYTTIIPEYEKQFLKWVHPLTKKDFRGKIVLDAGCGMGRNSYWPLKYGSSEVVSLDYDRRTVESARRNLTQFKNAKVIFKSIYSIPYKDYFDISFSIGVIHHLDRPKSAIGNLVRATKKGGKVLIWVYGYKGNEWIVRYISPIRIIASKLAPFYTHFIAYFFSIPLFVYLKLFKPKREYLRLLSKFTFKPLHLIVFDQLIPKIAHYWTKEEVLRLFENQGLSDIKIYPVNGISWTVVGVKK